MCITNKASVWLPNDVVPKQAYLLIELPIIFRIVIELGNEVATTLSHQMLWWLKIQENRTDAVTTYL